MMKSTIIAKDIDASQSLRKYIADCIDTALGHVQDSIQYITVRVSDLNDPKPSGLGKCVRIQLKLPGLPTVIVSDVGASINSAIDRVARRVESIADRHLERAHATRPVKIPALRRIAMSRF